MPSVLADTRSSLQSMWDLTIHPPSGPSVLAGTSPDVHPLQGSPSSLAHCPVSTSFEPHRPHRHTARCLALIPFVSRYCPLWAFLFGLHLKVFKTRLLGRGSHTLIKNVSFPSPTGVRSHTINQENIP